MIVFIDESGDPGFKIAKGSSPVFVLALVAFRDREQVPGAISALDTLAREYRIFPEFKFNQSRPAVKDAFFNAVAGFDYCVRAIVVDKSKIYSNRLRSEKEAFYSYFVKSMLRFDDGLLKNAKIVIDGSGDQTFKRELGAYLRRHTGPGAIDKVTFSDSKGDRMIQLADMCAGAIARSFRQDRDDATRWRDMIAPKIEDIWNFR